MANSILTEENGAKIASVAAILLGDSTVLAKTVTRDFEADFTGGVGSRVRMRRPALLSASRRLLTNATDPLTVADLNETAEDVAISHLAYSAVSITEDEATLSIGDFTARVVVPQTSAVAADIEAAVASALQSIPQDAALTSAYDATDPLRTFVDARRQLRSLGVPMTDGQLYAALGVDAMSDLLAANALRDASQSGTPDVLQNASPGRLYGFTVVESDHLAPNELVFYHRAAAALVVRAPAVPSGATGGSVASDAGALTWLSVLDPATIATRSVVMAYVGATVLSHPSRTSPSAPVVPAVRVGGAA